MSFRSDQTIVCGQEPNIVQSPMLTKACPFTPLTQSLKCEPYYMNSPTASISATQNCVDEISLENAKQDISQSNQVDSLQTTKNTLTSEYQLQECQISQKNLAFIQEPQINQKYSCKARQVPFTTAFTGIPCQLNDDNEDNIQKSNGFKRGKSQSNSEAIRRRQETVNLKDRQFGMSNKNNQEETESDSDDSLSDSDSSISNSDFLNQKYQLDNIQDNLNQNLTFQSTNDIQFNLYPYYQFNGSLQNQYNYFDTNQQNIKLNENIQQNNFNLTAEQLQERNFQQHLLKKGIHKNDHLSAQKKKFKYGYKNMSREEYQEYRIKKAEKREKRRIEKEQNAGSIQTESIYKLVLVESIEKPKKAYIPKKIREQMEMEQQLNSENRCKSASQVSQAEQTQTRKTLQKTNDQQYEIFQFSRTSEKPLVRTVYKKELVVQFQVETENPFALMEIGVFNYQDNIEFYFINKFKIINKFINRNYNQNKYFETELTSEDFIFKNGTKFEFSVKYNCIILKNLDTQESTNLYCDKYIASNKKLNIFIRLFKGGDVVHLL
ncbi:hypothetical protein TTHERM_00313270 (macronuclear) [Tetrahymena thermophila SB210]|uniref:Uncharacterized protein n=1 Tax=Tetrahymena thermophila (strain SB210) TaxID=312017 RepID=Q22KF4_TETTS|nr:hypothetical protein TTHERM_00313270 [Tetrahymena thermophila SB210]EAR85845.1 hypothetical protein TTHERM_00313270 [Tetrahymena thermophila SB210]|eukprot:XP_001033508.1 hypothetical protein TTHERM_00313270 [Tetrahymena thermophila SB210]